MSHLLNCHSRSLRRSGLETASRPVSMDSRPARSEQRHMKSCSSLNGTLDQGLRAGMLNNVGLHNNTL